MKEGLMESGVKSYELGVKTQDSQLTTRNSQLATQTRVALTGNDAVALAFKQVDPDVAAVYPITPQTELMHKFADYVSNGEVHTELVLVESEHSAMSASIGSSAAGARTITATSSQGLALMWEMLYIAASYRLPIVMVDVNRALSGPLNIHCDHSDTMGCRDTGLIQLFSENSQEAYDNTIQAFRIAEHPDVQLPVMVTLDGFIISHTVEALKVFDDETVKNFVGEFKPLRSLLDTDNPITMGPLDLPNYYFEHKREQVESMERARKVISTIGNEFETISGRKYGFFEPYKLDDAELAIVLLGSTAGTAKDAVDLLREEGIRAGLLKLRVFRPFPGREIVKALSKVRAVGVFDRSISFGLEGGPLFNEVRSFAFGSDFKMASFIYGLGGRDINVAQIRDAFLTLKEIKDTGRMDTPVQYIGIRE